MEQDGLTKAEWAELAGRIEASPTGEDSIPGRFSGKSDDYVEGFLDGKAAGLGVARARREAWKGRAASLADPALWIFVALLVLALIAWAS